MPYSLSYANLTTAIRDYTEVSATVLTQALIDQMIANAEQRIWLDVPIDSNRKVSQGAGLAVDDNTINVPAGSVFVRGVEVFNSTANTDGAGTWLIKKDQTYLSEYTDRLTGPEGNLKAQDVTGFPKYYAMFGGATAMGSTTSGGLYIAPTPDQAYMFRIYYDHMPTQLSSATATTYLTDYFPQGLLYAALVEAYGFLKGPMDMLTLYENKYKQEVAKFAGVQIGRRRRDDYTDGTVRIPIKSPNP
jgi:hypothetical protein|tara:strand:+ start:900 stop:1637 length:738 start_codon:yes stop_codon:yes gene_type:complete